MVTIALQILIGLMSVYAVYLLAHRLVIFREPWNSRAAVRAASLYAIEPLSVLFTTLLLTETLFTALFLGHLHGMMRYLETRSLRFIGLAGLFGAAAIFVRPLAYYWPLVAAGLLLGYGVLDRRALARRLVAAVLLVVISMVPIGLWQVRNSVQTGYRGFSAIREHNLYLYLGASVLAANEGNSFTDVRDRLDNTLDQKMALLEWGPAQRFEYMGREGMRIIVSQPLTYMAIHVKGVVRSLVDPGANEYLKFFKLYPESGGIRG